MSLDLQALVLGPCMDAWAKPVKITPVRSQPTAAPYWSQGIWIVDQANLIADNGEVISSRTIKIGINLSDYPIPPVQYDFLSSRAADIPMGYFVEQVNPNAIVDFVIDNYQPDGQGGAHLILKRKPIK